MDHLTPRQQKDLRILISFVALFCRSRHGGLRSVPLEPEVAPLSGKPQLFCPECVDLVGYAAKRLNNCPLKPKPSCKKCHVHCYRPDYRQKIREIMAWSGKRLLLRGRLDLLFHYLT